MLGRVLRIISTLVLGIFFIILIHISFFQEIKPIDAIDIQDILSYSGSETSASGSIGFAKEVSLFESIFSSQKTFPYTQTSSGFIFDISQTGSYMTSLRDMQKNYVFQDRLFRIIQNGVGEIYFDVGRNPNTFFVFPLNTSLEIQLLGEQGEVFTKIFLTPHMYAEIDLSKIARLKNADALRVQTLYRIGYFAPDISQISSLSLFEKYGIDGIGFFSQAWTQVQKNNFLMSQILNTFIEQEVPEVFTQQLFEKYKSYFINPEKKKIYYKNEIIKSYKRILEDQKFNESEIKKLQNMLQDLSKLDEASYTTMLQIQNHIRAFLASSYEKYYIIPQVSFESLSDENFDQNKTYFFLYSYSLFGTYDIKKEFSGDLVSRFLQSFVIYSDSNGEDKKGKYQYFLFFLEHQLSFLLNYSSQEDQVSSIVASLKNYIDVSELYSDKSSGVAGVTTLYIYNEILKNIGIYLRNSYFLEERNSQNVLILGEKRFNSKDMISLKTEVERVFKIYDALEKTLNMTDPRNLAISRDILNSRAQIREYFLALENYQAYLSEYNLIGKAIFEKDNTLTENNELTQEKVQKFFSGFQGVDTGNFQVSIQDGYYQIKNMFISGKLFDFDLYPYFTFYRMTNIFIDGQEQIFVYNIDNQTSDSSTPTEKSSFFLETFFNGEAGNENQDYIKRDTNIQEDKDIIILKRDVLLGKNGYFSPLSTILDISYESLNVTKTALGYQILLANIPTNISESNKIFFNGEFVFSESEKFFKSVSFTIDESTSLFVPGKIRVENIGNVIKDIYTLSSEVSDLSKILQSRYSVNNYTIQYMPSTQKTIFKFDSFGKKYSITLAGDQVEKIYIGTNNILEASVKVKDIGTYLQ